MDQTATVSREAAAQVLQVDVSPLMPQHKEKQERALINLKRLNELKQARLVLLYRCQKTLMTFLLHDIIIQY